MADRENENRSIGDRAYYDSWYGTRSWQWYSALLAQVVLRSAPGPILDIGAGAGLFVECATRWGLDCEGIEGSEEGVQIGKARDAGLRIRQHFLSEPFPFPDDTFQTVMMHQVIEHLEPEIAGRALREIARLLRSGGVFLVYSPNRFNRAEREEDPTHINMYTPGELRRALVAAGFRDIEAMDGPLYFLGQSSLGKRMARLVFRLSRWERLSATANCCARKP